MAASCNVDRKICGINVGLPKYFDNSFRGVSLITILFIVLWSLVKPLLCYVGLVNVVPFLWCSTFRRLRMNQERNFERILKSMLIDEEDEDCEGSSEVLDSPSMLNTRTPRWR